MHDDADVICKQEWSSATSISDLDKGETKIKKKQKVDGDDAAQMAAMLLQQVVE